jgi:HD-like signal output (HDOD) protein
MTRNSLSDVAAELGTTDPVEAGFVLGLSDELGSGRVQIPGFPDVVLKVQRVLNDERSDLERIVLAITVEPVLAMQIMRMANSVAFNTSGQPVRDVRGAVQRIGGRLVRAATLAFAIQQLRSAPELQPIHARLGQLWSRGVDVGVLCRALAQRVGNISSDAGLLAGMLHIVGRLYLLTRLCRLPQLLEQTDVVERLMERWHARCGEALLTNWEMPMEYAQALLEFENPERATGDAPSLADLLAAGYQLVDLLPAAANKDEELAQQAQLTNLHAQTEGDWRRLGMNCQQCSELLHSARDDATQLRATFGA